MARALQAHGVDHPDVTYLGCSAGALAAVGLALDGSLTSLTFSCRCNFLCLILYVSSSFCEGDFDAAMEFCKDECIPRAFGEVFGLFQLGQYVSDCLDLHLLPKYKPIPAGKLQIASTRLPWFQHERIVDFSSQIDLKSALLSSAAAFPAASLVQRKSAETGGLSWYMDGGLTDFQPIIDESTITVSPFYFR